MEVREALRQGGLTNRDGLDEQRADESYFEDAEYRGKLGYYYGPGGAGWRDWS
jgi:hypothetical protein